MKILRKTLKIISIVILSIFIFLILLVSGAKIFENDLASLTMDQLESQIDAPMAIGKVSIIPLFSFPRVSAEINDLWIGNPENPNSDTLFCIRSLKLGLDSWDLMDGIYTIDKVEISGLNFDYTVDKNGKSNIDFLINVFVDSTMVTDTVMVLPNDRVITPLDLTAEKCKIENIRINYYDSLTKIGSQVYIPEITIKAKAKDNIYKGKTEGSFILKNCCFEETNICLMESCTVNFELEYEDNKAVVKRLAITTEGIEVEMEGDLILGDTLTIDADVVAKTLDFYILKKYIPKQYLNDYGIMDISGTTDITANIKGQYADSTLLPQVNADVTFNGISLKTKEYPEIKSLKLAAHINSGEKPDMSDIAVNITALEIKTPESSVFLKGTLSSLENPRYNISATLDLNLKEFENYIPDSITQNPLGKITANISTKGVFPDKITDDFYDYFADRSTLSLKLSDISASLPDSLAIENFSTDINYSPQDSGFKKILIKNLYLESETLKLDLQNSSLNVILSGNVSDPMNMDADLQAFKIENGNNLIVGSAKIKNFEAPKFDIKTHIYLTLEELMTFAPDSLIKNMSGTVKARIQTKGSIQPDSLDSQVYPLLFENSNIDLTFRNICLEFPDSIMNVDSISANIRLKDDKLEINNLSSVYNGLHFKMDSTIVENIYKAVVLNQKEELYVKTQFEIGDIFFDDFKHLMALNSKNSSLDTNSVITDIPKDTVIKAEPRNWSFLIHGKASINSIIIDSTELEGININQLHINDLSTLFKLSDSAYIVDQFKFKAFEGEMNNSFHYKIRQDSTQSVSSHNVIKGMNIHMLLRDMDNFGMDSVISYENISGIFSTDLNTFIPICDSLLMHKMMVSGGLTLEKGGVYDYEPAQKLSKFSGIKELDNIQFKTLHSNIFMFKNKLYIPRTDIVSNAIDIAAFGMQSMESDYQYHLEVHLTNILFGKSKKRNKKQDAVGDEVDKEVIKKSSYKLRYADIDGDSKAGWDTKDARNKMMNKIRVQEKMLNFIFLPKNIHYNTTIDKNY